MLTRVRSVVNTYDVTQENDAEIEVSFTEAVNDSLRELESEGCEIGEIQTSTYLSGEMLVKSADITFTSEEEVDFEDDEEVEEVPTLGAGRKKVTREVYNFVKDKLDEGYESREIVEMFDGQLSTWTINKIANTRSFSRYYAK